MMYYISKLVLELLARIVFKITICGRENLPVPPYIIISNHGSYVDPTLVGMLRRWNKLSFMAKKELFGSFMSRTWFRAVGCIEVDRDKGVAGLRKALHAIKHGRSVAIFPEGTRSVDGSLQEAKKGAGFLILRAAVPVVPVYIHGTHDALPKNGGVKYGTKMSLHAGRPFMVEDFASFSERKDYGGAATLVMDRIAELKESVEKG